MRAVLISIKPKWCAMIARGTKTVEVRKNRPNLGAPFKCYIYCTYGEGLIEYYDKVHPNALIGLTVTRKKTWGNCCNGKVVGEFVCDKAMISFPGSIEGVFGFHDLIQGSCLSLEELWEYSDEGKTLYGWHISNLVIYNEPKELSEFTGLRETKFGYRPIPMSRPPQNWCYVEEM